MAVVAALTAQNTAEVTGVFPVEPHILRAQLDSLLSDIRPSALKTGMLYSSDNVEAVARAVREHRLPNLVVDPVGISSSGKSLMAEGAQAAMLRDLLPIAAITTPNLAEAGLLASMRVDSLEGMQEAARYIKDLGPAAVVVTGGHLEDRAIDVFYDGRSMQLIEGVKLPGQHHGTGCAYSACMTALLAHGTPPFQAARRAKEIIRVAIRDAFRPGSGMGILRI